MKIGLAAFVLQGGKTGVAAYVRDLVLALQEVDEENEYEILVPRRDVSLIPVSRPNFSVIGFPDVTANPLVSIAWHNTVLPVLARRRGYSLVHIPTYRRLPLVKGAPIVGTVHDLAAFSLRDKYDRARMFFNLKVVPFLIRRADGIITVSRYTGADIVRIARVPEDRVRVVYSGIDHTRFRRMGAEEARAALRVRYGWAFPFLVYVARVEHPAKNHVRLLEAFREIRAERPDLKLVFAGADWHGADVVHAKVGELGLEGSVINLGFVPGEVLPELYSCCEAMVFPSLFEGFGFPLIEAMACGAPVACSATSSLKELAGAHVPTFDPMSAGDIARGIRDCLRDGADEEKRAARIGYAQGFQWRRAALDVLDVYRRVGERGKGTR